MGITNAETNPRGTEEKRDVYADTGRDEDVGGESQTSRHQQKRVNRANRSKQSLFRSTETITGGMLTQLIEDYRAQLASKKNEIQFLQTLIQNSENEALRLEARIQEFESLQEELEEEIKESA